jgi:hypothetical protein
MRAYELKESAIEELKNRLPKLKSHTYDTIDDLMQDISVKHKITGKKLHDMFVHKYGHTPDTWIKKIKNKLGEEDVVEGGHAQFHYKNYSTSDLLRMIKTIKRDEIGLKIIASITSEIMRRRQGVKEAFQNDEANLFYRYDSSDGRIKQRMISNDEERQAFAQGYRGTIEQALRVHNIIRSKFDPKKFKQKQGTQWVTVYPFGKPNEQGVAEGSESSDNLVSTLNSFGYYSDNGNVYVNDDSGDKIARQGSNWKHQSGKRGAGAEELGEFLGSKQGVAEESKGLWANIHAKRNRIKNGSGEKMRKPGSKGAPTASALKKSANEGRVTSSTQKKSNVNEAVEGPEDVEKIKHFIKWSYKTLNMQKPYPKITISKNTEVAQKGHHTGVHNGNDIWVYVGNRNLIDIFRTIFHELTHHRQMQLNMIKDGDSYPGSPIEMLADMAAGKYIKFYGKEHPEIFQ